MGNKIITGLIVIVAIVVAMIFAGCSTQDTSPSRVVGNFALLHQKGDFETCYSLMSTEYKNLTDEKAFRDKIKHCNDYHLIKVKSKKIEGDTASVKIEYGESNPYDTPIGRLGTNLGGLSDEKSKTLNLVKEEDGWKLVELYCELKSE